MGELYFNKSVYVQTANTRNLVLMMDDLAMDVGEGRFACVYGGAGLGKSEAVKWYHANHADTIYIESSRSWKTSSLAFLSDLCRELGIERPKRNRDWCFRRIIEALYENPDTVIFLDEADRLGTDGLEYARDITRITFCPIVLIGEMRLLSIMQQNERIWTRTFEPVQFAPMKESDVIIYAQEAAGAQLSIEVAGILHQTRTKNTANGNFRLVKRALLYAIAYANAAKSQEITKPIAEAAIKSAIKWATKR
jgi:DNA transposition AAA+ family ATPase